MVYVAGSLCMVNVALSTPAIVLRATSTGFSHIQLHQVRLYTSSCLYDPQLGYPEALPSLYPMLPMITAGQLSTISNYLTILKSAGLAPQG